ncbi:MAG: methyltransferase [Paludibacteraceae bacterium]|nr:methyltransferase [Paludibacteraceae bacterium]
MPNPYFQFKQFSVYQDKCAMKVGTDGVLLGAWVDCKNAIQILDVGTGTGLIAMMLAQRSFARIHAVEVDTTAARQAEENIRESPWKNRIAVFPIPFQNIESTGKQQYDLIVSNPPYFQNSLKPPHEGRGIARHTDTLPFSDLINGSKRILNPNGKLAVILPVTEGEQFIIMSEKADLFCQQKTIVIPRPGAEPKRLLISFGLKAVPCTTSELLIETGTRHTYSEEYIELTKDFYLDK